MTTDEGVYGQTGAKLPAGLAQTVTLDASGNLYLVGGLNMGGQIISANGLTLQGLGTPLIVAHAFSSGSTATVTMTYTPPSAAGTYELSVYVNPTTAGTSTIPKIAYKDEAGSPVSATAIPMVALGGTALLASITAVGHYSGWYKFKTDASGTAITVTVVPNGSTFNCSLDLYNVAGA